MTTVVAPMPARPKILVTEHDLREMAAAGLTLTEQADMVGCSTATIAKRRAEFDLPPLQRGNRGRTPRIVAHSELKAAIATGFTKKADLARHFHVSPQTMANWLKKLEITELDQVERYPEGHHPGLDTYSDEDVLDWWEAWDAGGSVEDIVYAYGAKPEWIFKELGPSGLNVLTRERLYSTERSVVLKDKDYPDDPAWGTPLSMVHHVRTGHRKHQPMMKRFRSGGLPKTHRQMVEIRREMAAAGLLVRQRAKMVGKCFT